MTDIATTQKERTKQLGKLEKRIEANTKAAWQENGLIMLHIRNAKLYKPQYKTFEDYLSERWHIARRTGYQQLAAAEFLRKIQHCSESSSGDLCAIAHKNAMLLPDNEAQVRPLLTDLQHDGERMKVWDSVVEEATKSAKTKPTKPGKSVADMVKHEITAELVQRKVDEFMVKLEAANVSQNTKLGHIEKPVFATGYKTLLALIDVLK